MKINEFFDRPLGGVEIQLFIGFSSLWWALSLLIGDTSLWNIQSLQSFYGWIPSRILAIPWLISGTLDMAGGIARIWWFLKDRKDSPPWEPPISFVAGMISCPIWSWIFLKSMLLFYGTLPGLGLYLMASLGGFRGMFSAWRRW